MSKMQKMIEDKQMKRGEYSRKQKAKRKKKIQPVAKS